MKDKEQREEIEKIVRNAYDIPHQIAEALYNNNYRKIEEGSVIITKKEDENRMLAEVYYRKERDEEVHKETAKEIISYLGTLKEDDGTPFKDYIWYKYLCKKYGVEVEK